VLTIGARADSALIAWERRAQASPLQRLRRALLWIGAVALFVVCWRLAGIDIPRLVNGLPKLGHWLAMAWPPKFEELPVFLLRMGETVAMAAMGTLFACLFALPAAWLASRNITPVPALYLPMRWILNAFRGVDAFVFALLFVASVGLGPFAGVLGVLLHTWGSAAKLLADAIENANLDALRAVETSGASRLVAIRHALVPEVSPVAVSTALYLFEFNVRASMVLGLVGAGGIGQELKNSVDLLDFGRLATILLVILVFVTIIDTWAAWLRRRWV
jgi:phosphonate transport system permease protein